MKKKFILFFIVGISITSINLRVVTAQNWSLVGNNNATSSSKLGTTNNISLRFYTNNVQRMIINSAAGLVGIGTASPSARLHINSASGKSPLQVQVNGSTKLLIDQYGTVAIGTSIFTTSYKLLISSSSKSGIYTNGVDFGVRATSPNIGVQGYGSVKGVFGYSNTNGGKGVNGYAEQGYGGFFESFNGTALYAKTYNGFYAAVFYGNVFSSGTYYGSDKNIKKNIQEVSNAMNIINQLKPKRFDFRSDGKYASLNLPKGNHFGLIAQELEEVLPDLVKENSHDIYDKVPEVEAISAQGEKVLPPKEEDYGKEIIKIKAVNYTELITILIKGMQEQQTQMQQLTTEKDKQIADLQSQINDLKFLISKNNGAVVTSSTAFLKQNIPNPASSNTIISYYIPGNAGYAQIRITDIKGRVIKTFSASRDEGQIKIRSGELPAGVYNYTLYLNDKNIDTKQMVITK